MLPSAPSTASLGTKHCFPRLVLLFLPPCSASLVALLRLFPPSFAFLMLCSAITCCFAQLPSPPCFPHHLASLTTLLRFFPPSFAFLMLCSAITCCLAQLPSSPCSASLTALLPSPSCFLTALLYALPSRWRL